jgi:hypothetical protein
MGGLDVVHSDRMKAIEDRTESMESAITGAVMYADEWDQECTVQDNRYLLARVREAEELLREMRAASYALGAHETNCADVDWGSCSVNPCEEGLRLHVIVEATDTKIGRFLEGEVAE